MEKDKVNDGLSRKQFLTSLGKGALGLAAAGMAAPALPSSPPPPSGAALPFRLEPIASLEPRMDALHAVAWDDKDRLYAAGSAGVFVFTPQRTLERTIRASDTVVAIALDPEGFLYAAQRTKIEKFDPAGRLAASWGQRGDEPGQLRYATAIAAGEEWVYVTDSGARKIHRFAIDGDYAGEIEGPDPTAGKKFLIPSAFFDCKLDAKGILHVGHTGMHRVERYDPNNVLLGHWGRFGNAPADFCGCCNPTNLALLPDGAVATTEKGVPRLKVYDAQGTLWACVDPAAFPGNAAGMALAAAKDGRIALVEPISKVIRFYELKPNKA